MTIFTRTDRTTETATGAKAPMRETGDFKMTDLTDTRRAVAQPNSPGMAPHVQATPFSVISKALKITGQLESTEDIHIEGEVDGDVRAVNVKVGSNAKVKGTVYGDTVEIAGTIDGKIEAKKVVLTRTAHMSGDIVHSDITIESGAFMDGNCSPDFGKTANRPVQSGPKIVAAPRDQPVKNGDAAAVKI